MPQPIFFFSYARLDGDDYLVRFYEELAKRVADKAGVAVDDAGFRDETNLDLGEPWPDVLAENLARASCLVMMCSPRFFTRPYCGKEVAFFRQRLADANLPKAPLLLPLVWIPPNKGKATPEIIAKLQHTQNFGDEYEKRGLSGLLRLQRFRDNYEEILEKITDRIIEVTNEHALPAVPPPDLEAVAGAFADPQGGAGDEARAEGGPRHVRFIVVAAKRGEISDALAGAPLDRYGNQSFDWKPFLPPRGERVGPMLQGLASEADMTSEIREPGALLPLLESAAKANNLVLLVVDPWTIRLTNYHELLRVYDKHNFINAALILPYSEETGSAAQLRDAVEVTFANKSLARDAKTFRAGVSTIDEFKAILRDVMVEVKNRIFQQAEVGRKVQGAGVFVKPVISAVRE